MTAPTPEQMRLQAFWLDGYADGIEDTIKDGEQPDIDSHRTAAAALRAAADRLEAVQRYVLDGECDHDDGGRFVWTYSLRRLLGLPDADTAPQGDNHV